MMRILAAATAICALVPSSVYAQPAGADDLAQKFGAREGIQSISLAPDGAHIAIVVPMAVQGEAITVADLVSGGAPKVILTSTTPGEHIRSCAWPTASRLVCRLTLQSKSTGQVLGLTRMISLNSDGSDVKMLTKQDNSRSLGIVTYGGGVIDWTGTKPGTVLMMREYIPESTLGTKLAQTAEGIGVEQVDVVTLARHNVETPRRDAVSYITDGQGRVRIMGTGNTGGAGYDKGTVDYYYRAKDKGGWNALSRVDGSSGGLSIGFDPVSVDPQLDAVYGFEGTANGRTALFREKLDGSGTKELVLGRDDVDVDQLNTIGRNARVIGASYATDRRMIEIFDPELKALGLALAKALPGQPQISFVDSSADEGKLLLLAGSDVDPGQFYLFDKATRHLEQVLPVRPQLAGARLSPMRAISFPAADGTSIPGYLTIPAGSSGKGLPAIVMPHGGPTARDEWGFDWLVQYFAARGYAVLQPNYRGSSGYGVGWYKDNGFKSWRTAIGDVDDAGRWLVAQGIAAPGKLAVVGWSYGGYAALQSGVTEPGLYRAVVAIAPVTDLEQLRQDRSNYTDYKVVSNFIGQGDHIRAGSPAQNARAMAVPVVMFHGSWDTNVDPGQSRLMADQLKSAGKSVELVEFPGLTHSLDDSAARASMLARSDAFLRKALGL